MSVLPLLHILQLQSPNLISTRKFLFSNIGPTLNLQILTCILVNCDFFPLYIYLGIAPNKKMYGFSSNFIFRFFSEFLIIWDYIYNLSQLFINTFFEIRCFGVQFKYWNSENIFWVGSGWIYVSSTEILLMINRA